MDIPVIGILLFDGIELLDFAGPLEVFYRSRGTGKKERFEVFTFSIDQKEIVTEGGLKIIADKLSNEIEKINYLLIPGGPGARTMSDNSKEVKYLQKLVEITSEIEIMTVCTGSFIAALTGKFDNFAMTTHYSRYGLFKQLFPHIELIEKVRIVSQKKFLSAGGITSGIDLALYFISEKFGEKLATQVASTMEYKFDYESGTSTLSSLGAVSR